MVVNDIYKILGTLLNGPKQKIFFKDNRELLFYRCHQSQNRGDMHLDKLHATVCIIASKTIQENISDEVLCNGQIKETVCSLNELLISINIFDNLDYAMDTMNALRRFLKLSTTKDYFTANKISVKAVKEIRKLDEIVKEKYEYRSQLEIEVMANMGEVSDTIDVWDEVTLVADGCVDGEEITVNRLDVDCV